MVSLRPATPGDLDFVVGLEAQPHAQPFITALPREQHATLLSSEDILHLVIESMPGAVSVGYFLLALESDGETVELRRVIVDANARGIGQQALIEVIAHCRESLRRTRLWLDVFDDNHRGIHIYEKLGFVFSRSEPHEARNLLFYDMRL